MKTVCKKLLCLMLVAVLLVSAIPAAFATGNYNFWIRLYVDEELKGNDYVSIPAGTDMDEAAIISYAQTYLFGEYFGGGNTVNRVVGAAVVDADNMGAEIYLDAPAASCQHADTTVSIVGPTCTVAGTKTTACADCGDVLETESIPAPGHEYVDGVCACGAEDPNYEAPEGNSLILTLWADDEQSSCKTITMTEGGVVPNLMPYNPPKKDGWTFDHWETKAGKTLTAGASWAASFGTEFYPVYYRDAANDGVSKLNVYAVFYADGIKRSAAHLFTEEFDSSSKSSMFDWLKSDGGVSQIRAALNNGGYTSRYTWDNQTIYNYYPSTNDAGYAVTKADMDSNGAKNVCIKLNANAEYMSDVFVYVHKTKTATAYDVLEMKGYMIGDNVSLASVKTTLKNAGYKYKTISMYNDSEWAEVVRGENTTPRDSVEATGTTKIHVYLSNVTYSSNADKTNPKTGDMITIAVTGMALSAAALVSMIELKKRKMI